MCYFWCRLTTKQDIADLLKSHKILMAELTNEAGRFRLGGVWKPIFNWLPVETLIRERQQEYYTILAVADKAADSTVFVEFMLCVIRDALNEFMQTEQVREQVTNQVERLMSV